MAKTISSLNVVLGASTTAFSSAFSKAEESAQTLTSSMANVGSAIAKITGASLALDALDGLFDRVFAIPGQAFEAAMKQSDVETRLGAVLRATGDAAGFSREALDRYASELMHSTTFGKSSIESFQAVLATFRNVSGPVFMDATSLALDMSAALGTNLDGAAIQLGKALNDPVQGVTALRKVGVSFTQAQLAQIKAMEGAGNMAGAQAVILAELKNEFGGVAASMATTPFGRFKQLGNVVTEDMVSLGNVLADVGLSFANAFDVGGVLDGIGA